MPLIPGTRLGVYDITARIGVGGMGEVYRATDSNLKRSVAIKALPAAVAGDADRLARFQREAEVLAALNHTNIVTPIWSPDSRRVAFGSRGRNTDGVYVKAVSGGEDERLLMGDAQTGPPSDWSPDGRFILFARQHGPFRDDIWALPVDDVGKAFPVVETPFHEENGQFSPDGRWIAYQSTESGQLEIYVQRFRGPGPKTRISSEGGVQARWRHDGKELYYLAPDNRLMAVPILRLDSDRVDIGTPIPLFGPIGPVSYRAPYARHYTVSRDGQRFLVSTVKEVTLPITVVLNWKPKH